jgi:hypothetical protein
MDYQPGPLAPRTQGAGKGQAFIHPRGVRLWVKPYVVMGKRIWGWGCVDHLNTFAQNYLCSSPTTQANNFYHFGNDQNYFR